LERADLIVRTRTKLVNLAIASALIAAMPAPVLAQNVFGRSLAQMSSADRQAMEQSRREVLERMEQGAVSTWRDEATGHSGEVRLRRVYEQNGMRCAELEQILRSPAESRYVIPFCRTTDGTWRAAF
jgi:surface antigen